MSTPRIFHMVGSWRSRGKDIRGIDKAVGVNIPIPVRAGKKIERTILRDARRVGVRIKDVDRDMVITPPTTVMPPKKLLGYHSNIKASIRDIASWYIKCVNQHCDQSQKQTYSDIRTLEEECGMLTTYSKRPRVMCDWSWHSTNFISNEIQSGGKLSIADYRLPSKSDSRKLEQEAHESNNTSYVSFTVSKTSGISHDSMVYALCRILRLSPEKIGCMEVQSYVGYTSQKVIINMNDIRMGYLGRVIGKHIISMGYFTCTEFQLIKDLSQPPKSFRSLISVSNITDVSPRDVSLEMQQFTHSGGVFANLFDPTCFNAITSRPIPSWVIGWHLYRLDDIHVVYSLISQFLLMERYKKYKGIDDIDKSLLSILRVPSKEWNTSKIVMKFKQHIHNDFRSEGGGNPVIEIRCVILKIISYVSKTRTFKGVVKHLIDTQPDVIGSYMSSFHKLVWNILASERIAIDKNGIHGDVLMKTGMPTLAGTKDAVANADICDIVIPLSNLLTSEKATNEHIIPEHRYANKTAELILHVFGLRHIDIDRWYHLLPSSFRNTPYRRIVGKVSELDYMTGHSFMPLIEDAVFSKKYLHEDNAEHPTDVFESSKLAALSCRVRDVPTTGLSQETTSHAAFAVTTKLDSSPYCVVREFFYPRVTRLRKNIALEFEMKRRSKE